MKSERKPLSPRDWQAYSRLLTYAKPYRWRLVAGIAFGAIFGFSMGGLLGGAGEFVGRVFGRSVDQATIPVNYLVIMAITLPIFAILRGLGDYCSTYFVEWVGTRVVMDLRMRLFDHLQIQSLRFFGQNKTGELIAKITTDTAMIENAVSNVLADLCKQPFALIGVLMAMILKINDWRLPLIGLALFPFCILPVAYFGRRVRRFAKEGQARLAEMTAILQENIAGARVVRAFTMEDYERGRFYEQCHATFSRSIRVVRAKALVDPLIVSMSFVAFAAFLIFCVKQQVTIKDVIIFAGGLVMLYDPVKKLSRIHISIQRSSASADRIFELLDTPSSVVDRAGAMPFTEPVKQIVFDHVSFTYGEDPVLTDVQLIVPVGARVALVGGSGAGKSTMVGLIPRFYDVTGGCIRINGVDVRDITLNALRHLVGMVTQETFLFNDTVAANIAYGCGTANRAAIEHAARMAHAHEFILQMPAGYETIVGDRGMRLSGGQCQRLAIARAIFRNPPILILDEATSALDTESERLVQDALDSVMQGRTVLAIAHRLSTIMHCDQIVVLDHGRLVERGTHPELLALNGVYRRLYDLQFNDASR